MTIDLSKVKELLVEDSHTVDIIIESGYETIDGFITEPVTVSSLEVTILPIIHNDDVIILQLDGWSINLNRDGTWLWEDSGGG